MYHGVFDDDAAGRSLNKLASAGKWTEVINLAAFGASKTQLLYQDVDGGTLLHCLFANCDDPKILKVVCEIMCKADPSLDIWKQKDSDGKICVEKTKDEDAKWQRVRQLMNWNIGPPGLLGQ
eukprot:366291_1